MKSNSLIISTSSMEKLLALSNSHVIQIVEEYIALCKPSKVTVITDSPEDIAYIRQLAQNNKEEVKIAMAGHTIHYDGYDDQGRDKEHTRVLLPKGQTLSKRINTIDRVEGLTEIHQLMDGIMKGKEMLVRFFCLGPLASRFSIPALQITDSAYVAHSEDLLYRAGYEEFKRLKGSDRFFHFIHSAGELDERGCTKDISKRRIYIDLEKNRVFTINNQYAGNSVGLKKLALRLAINQANHEDWLSEHMFLMGIHPQGKTRTTYFTGAFPSACGKTSTAMIPGQTIIGDDIVYMKINEEGVCHAVNIESGIFGIIADVNPVDDPLIYKCLTTPRELIFSNILINNRKPYWLGMGCQTPETGSNHSGEWFKGKKDACGKEIPLAHKNARYTMRLSELENIDKNANTKDGVEVSAIIYGGRDSDTNVPVYQSFDWSHGVFVGATLESETTAATLGKEGQRAHSPMANLDFIVVPLGKYIENHLTFGRRMKKTPLVFSTNYFLKGQAGEYLNDKV
ncbi:MAG: phosphoenolpyruvate carboxykinase (GTP), partial [Candidatus Marinimicrobia bacterium]|nr:phosphoenolpyruvate carboxykinase (GTP) [Candidatus Neomarinimicrobiota bacterium]